jgi:hypothetical protein
MARDAYGMVVRWPARHGRRSDQEPTSMITCIPASLWPGIVQIASYEPGLSLKLNLSGLPWLHQVLFAFSVRLKARNRKVVLDSPTIDQQKPHGPGLDLQRLWLKLELSHYHRHRRRLGGRRRWCRRRGSALRAAADDKRQEQSPTNDHLLHFDLLQVYQQQIDMMVRVDNDPVLRAS